MAHFRLFGLLSAVVNIAVASQDACNDAILNSGGIPVQVNAVSAFLSIVPVIWQPSETFSIQILINGSIVDFFSEFQDPSIALLSEGTLKSSSNCSIPSSEGVTVLEATSGVPIPQWISPVPGSGVAYSQGNIRFRLSFLIESVRYRVETTLTYDCGCPERSSDGTCATSGCTPCETTCNAGKELASQTCRNKPVALSVCAACQASFFKPSGGSEACRPCTVCGTGQLQTAACTTIKDSVCVLTAEKDVLLEFRLLMSPAPQAGFWSQTDICAWSGVTCASVDGLMRVTQLEISARGLTGIPSTIVSLSELSVLSLPTNQLSGSLPSSLSALTKLKTLNLASNNLEGNLLSPELAFLANIETLDLSSNTLQGQLRSQYFSSNKMVSLKLADNALSGSIVSSPIVTVGALTLLDVSGNMLTGEVPEIFEDIASLSLGQQGDYRLTCPLPPQAQGECTACGLAPVDSGASSPFPPAAVFNTRSVEYSCNEGLRTISGSTFYKRRCNVDVNVSYDCVLDKTLSACSCLSSRTVVASRALSLDNIALEDAVAAKSAIQSSLLFYFELATEVTLGDFAAVFRLLSSGDVVAATIIDFQVSAVSVGPTLTYHALAVDQQLQDMSAAVPILQQASPSLLSLASVAVGVNASAIPVTPPPLPGAAGKGKDPDSQNQWKIGIFASTIVAGLVVFEIIMFAIAYKRDCPSRFVYAQKTVIQQFNEAKPPPAAGPVTVATAASPTPTQLSTDINFQVQHPTAEPPTENDFSGGTLSVSNPGSRGGTFDKRSRPNLTEAGARPRAETDASLA